MRLYASVAWRANDLVLGSEWDGETLMEVHGNASALVPHTPLPDAILAWLAADPAREVVLLRDCNVMNRDLPERVTLESGGVPVHVEFDALLGYEEYYAPDGTVTLVEIRGNRVVP